MCHVLWDHWCSWLWDFRSRHGWRCFSCRGAFMGSALSHHGQQPTLPCWKGQGRWQTFPWRDRWQPGHPSPLMQGFLCIWELMRVWPCFYQLCNSGCSKWVKKKMMAPQSGLAQSASWVQIVLGEENAAGKSFPLMLEDLSPRTFFKVLNTAQITWAGGQPVCLIWSQKDMIQQYPCG